jgi:heme exporter protein B
MTLISEIKHLVIKDIRLELKQKYAINGILLYIVSTIFLCSLAFERIVMPVTWNALFWVILLFAAVNAVSKSFIQENQGRQLYYYTLASAKAIILAKMLYNIILMLVLSTLFYLIFTLFLGSYVVNHFLFFITILLGGIGFATLFTMVSAIASRTNNNFALMAVLGFPIILPLLVLLIKVSKSALTESDFSSVIPSLVGLSGLNLIIIILSGLLFPYLWRD